MQLRAKLDSLLAKATKVAEENKRLKAKNTELTVEVEGLKQMLSSERKKAEELNNKIKIIKLAQNMGPQASGSIEIAEIKRKLNDYIKEIDNCMTMLNE